MTTEKLSSVFPGRKDLRISLTTRCNYNCSFCHAEGNDKPWSHYKEAVPTVAEIGALIEAVSQYDVRRVRFTGGEPTTYRHILELLLKTSDWAARYPTVARWGINTNGTAFVSNPRLRKLLLDSALNDLVVGMDSVAAHEKSKPSSTFGMSGAKLFEGMQSLAKSWLCTPGRKLKFNVVYAGAYDEVRVISVLEAARVIGAEVGVIELGGVVMPHLREKFDAFRTKVAHRFELTPRRDTQLDHVHLADKNGDEPIRFYQSHCRDTEIEANGRRRGCNASRNIHLRVGPTEEGLGAIPCPFEAAQRMIPLTRHGELVPGGFEDAMRYNGCESRSLSPLDYRIQSDTIVCIDLWKTDSKNAYI